MRQMLQTNPPYLHNSAVSYPVSSDAQLLHLKRVRQFQVQEAALQMVVGGVVVPEARAASCIYCQPSNLLLGAPSNTFLISD